MGIKTLQQLSNAPLTDCNCTRSYRALARRKKKDSKFGFGGKKRGMKSNSRDSVNDTSSYKIPRYTVIHRYTISFSTVFKFIVLVLRLQGQGGRRHQQEEEPGSEAQVEAGGEGAEAEDEGEEVATVAVEKSTNKHTVQQTWKKRHVEEHFALWP